MQKKGSPEFLAQYVHLLNKNLKLRPVNELWTVAEKKIEKESEGINALMCSEARFGAIPLPDTFHAGKRCDSPEDTFPSITSSTQEPNMSNVASLVTEESCFPLNPEHEAFEVHSELIPSIRAVPLIGNFSKTFANRNFENPLPQESEKENMTNQFETVYPKEVQLPSGTRRKDPLTGGAVAGYLNHTPAPKPECFAVPHESRKGPWNPIAAKSCLSQNRVIFKSRINRGFFASIYEGLLDGKRVAIKCQEPCEGEDPGMVVHRALQEWRVLESISHPNIVRFHGGVLSGNDIWLVTEFVEGGDLWTMLNCKTSAYLRPQKRLDIMIQIAGAISHLHQQNVAHKDVKSLNVLVKNDLSIRLCDLGDAEELEGDQLGWCTAATWAYAPPEMILCKNPFRPEGATKKVDVWAMGCVFLELCGCSLPYQETLQNVDETQQRAALRHHFHTGRLQQATILPPYLPNPLKSLLQMCLTFATEQRASSAQVLTFLKSHYHSILQNLLILQSSREMTFDYPVTRHAPVLSFPQQTAFPVGPYPLEVPAPCLKLSTFQGNHLLFPYSRRKQPKIFCSKNRKYPKQAEIW